MDTFDLSGPLPEAPVLLEASAGTGKTFTIAALAARLVAERGLGIEQLLLITFSNRAAEELRTKVFHRLESTRDDLCSSLVSGVPPVDETSAVLYRVSPELHLERITRAVENFEAASITTVHSFCQWALRWLGILGDWDDTDTISSTTRELAEQCGVDAYLERYGAASSLPFEPRNAMDLARAATESALPLFPAGEAASYAEDVRRRFAAGKRGLSIVGYDDLTLRLRDAVVDPATGGAAAEQLRARFHAVLVDEFQDTDPLQWDILRRVFVEARHTCILIGDPKQSIYGFRNADVLAYLQAAETMPRRTLQTNFRSDRPLVEGIEELFSGVMLGHPLIRLTPVATRHEAPRLVGPGTDARLWIRIASPDPQRIPEQVVDADVSVQVTRLLTTAKVHDGGRDSAAKPLTAADIAVLVRTRARGQRIVAALDEAGVPSQLLSSAEVFASSAAREWLAIAAAAAEPDRTTLTLAGMTSLIGTDPGGLTAAAGAALAEVARQCQRFATDLAARGPGVAAVNMFSDATPRLGSLPDGERRLADHHQLSELIGVSGARDADQLRRWLEEEINSSTGEEDSRLRAASERPAVKVLTLHASKGLEFPVVLLPEVSGRDVITYRPFPLVTQDQRRVLYCDPVPRSSSIAREYRRQERDEELRLLYVGLTRAQHLAIAWHDNNFARTSATGSGPLTALLARDPDTQALRETYSRLPETSCTGWNRVFISATTQAVPLPIAPPAPSNAPLQVAPWTRQVDQVWRRTSYSGLTAGVHDAPPGAADESVEVQLVTPATGTLASPMADLPGGTGFGTVVHAAFESLEWGRDTLAASATHTISSLAPQLPQGTSIPALTNAVIKACQTPLGGLAEGASLSDIPTTHRLPELDFDLPLGDRAPAAQLADLAQVLARHLPADDPLAEYPQRLAASAAADEHLLGFLTGSIDAVLRTSSGRYLVVDYKTNRFPPPSGADLMVEHYDASAMAEAMMQSHYPLQALLYSAALHRYLSWRHPGYDPDRHLGGVGYLFVRGMAGPATPRVGGMTCGVFEWYPPSRLVVDTSDLLGGVDE
ncbi:MAG: UvrD-helicase domain-containing protein [Arachnia sp.]